MSKYYQEHKERQDKLRCIYYYESKIGKEIVGEIRAKYPELDEAIPAIKQMNKLIKEQKRIQKKIDAFEEKKKSISLIL
jgi:hypothetical protein